MRGFSFLTSASAVAGQTPSFDRPFGSVLTRFLDPRAGADAPYATEVLATHMRHTAVATCLVSKRRPWAAVEKKAGRPPKGAHYIGISGEQLLFMGDEEDVDKVLKLRRPVLRRTPSLMIHTDLLDCQLYVLDVKAVASLLDAKPHMHSLQLDVIPALVRRQFRAGIEPGGPREGSDDAADLTEAAGRMNINGEGGEGACHGDNDGDDGLLRAVFGPSGKDGACTGKDGGGGAASSSPNCARPCCVHLAPDDAYCARVDTVVPAFLEVSREVASPAVNDAAHLIGRNPSKYENFVDGSVSIGSKSTIGPGCIVAEGVVLAEKCNVKKSVIGKGCSIGTGVKIINSILMPRATIEDGCSVQGCVVGPRAVVGAGTSLRECLVASEYEVEEGDDIRSETLANTSR